uniref:Uncharacterized protein n=1 Tax=Arundo donax TaxID=35708 RepID=A0A0A9AU31_ARUDO
MERWRRKKNKKFFSWEKIGFF